MACSTYPKIHMGTLSNVFFLDGSVRMAMTEAMFRRCSAADILDVLRKATSPYPDRIATVFCPEFSRNYWQLTQPQEPQRCDVEIEIDNLESSDTLGV